MMQLRRQATVDNHIDTIDETAIFRAGKGDEVADVFRRADTTGGVHGMIFQVSGFPLRADHPATAGLTAFRHLWSVLLIWRTPDTSPETTRNGSIIPYPRQVSPVARDPACGMVTRLAPNLTHTANRSNTITVSCCQNRQRQNLAENRTPLYRSLSPAN